MIVTIAKTFTFDAAHWLPQVADGHKCKRMHGHTYRVEVLCHGPIGPRTGWLIDYADIEVAWRPLATLLDHHVLNEIPGLENPTTERLAPWILAALVQSDIGDFVRSVRVYESSTTWCQVDR